MSARAGAGEPSNHISQVFALLRGAAAQLVRRPSQPRRGQAIRRTLRQAALLTAVLGVAIVVLMFAVDAPEIALMPPRGTASLWPVRILTEFGKAAYVLWSLAGLMLAVVVIAPYLRGRSRSLLLTFGTRLQFLLFAVAVPLLTGEIVKRIVGRGRPFVGGKANAFNFEPFAGNEAHASFPSAHAITAFALAFAVSAVWPQARAAMLVYAVLIGASRLVLLAHHPSDVVAGALIGVVGAMAVRYWFAARRLGFAVDPDGAIVQLGGRWLERVKRVARGASAP
jgi:membrane-associated phospholipid phosphatase